ncbi:diguanylate cyclase [Priestia megaterium]|uniref:Diguanylate cyclase n=1 Tax=Priestia megaterium TaxID=1404 RepID=A0AA86HWK6_PRIMG|nr:EAL domain-containing protein [Priestia megaterium]AXI27932.1 diguanylate cyclase [Priestia megaterium]
MDAHVLKELTYEDFQFVYQPIYALNSWETLGFEALLRTAFAKGQIEELFSLATRHNYLYKLDTMAIEGAIKNFPFEVLKSEDLFINVFPSTLLHPHFQLFLTYLLNTYKNAKHRIVWELNETLYEKNLWESPALFARVMSLKEGGFKIAIDDFGAGATAMRQVSMYEPHYMKLDRSYAEGLADSKQKKDLIDLLVNYYPHTNLILEGVERDKDLAAAISLNLHAAQGYLLGMPQSISSYLTYNKYRGLFRRERLLNS